MFYPNYMIQLNNFDSQLLKINKRIYCSKDRYLVINEDSLMGEKNISFFIYGILLLIKLNI